MTYPVVYTPEPTKPSGGAQPGTKLLLEFTIGTFDVAVMGDEIHSLGIYNPRDVCGNPWPKWKCKGSQHASGRAGDSGVPVVRPKGHSEGHRLADWLVANHAALGIQEVIWAGRRWENQGKQWKKYSGRSDHFDHVHWAQNAQAAKELTLEQIQAVWANNPAPPNPEDDMAKPEVWWFNSPVGPAAYLVSGDGIDAAHIQHMHNLRFFVDTLKLEEHGSASKPEPDDPWADGKAFHNGPRKNT